MLVGSISFCNTPARPRVQRAPGLPRALYSFRGQTKCKTSGDQRRENAKSYSRFVGWVERSDTHQYCPCGGGYRCAPPILRLRPFCYREPCMNQPLLDAAAEPGHSALHMRWPIASDVCCMDRMSHFAVQQIRKNSPC